MMRKIKSFIRDFIDSLMSPPDYYHKVTLTLFSNSFKYLFMSIMFLNLLLILYLFIIFNPVTVNKSFINLVNNLDKYPPDLTINIHKGHLLTSYNRPYFFWYEQGNKKRLFLVIDESAQPERIKQYHSNFLITTKDIVIKNRTQPAILPLNYLDDHTINKEDIVKLKNNILRLSVLLPIIYILFLPLILLILIVSSLVVTLGYSFIASFVNLIIFRLFFKKHPNLKNILKISFHAITLPLIVDYGLIMSGIRPLPFLFLFSAIVFTFARTYEGVYFSAKMRGT